LEGPEVPGKYCANFRLTTLEAAAGAGAATEVAAGAGAAVGAGAGAAAGAGLAAGAADEGAGAGAGVVAGAVQPVTIKALTSRTVAMSTSSFFINPPLKFSTD